MQNHKNAILIPSLSLKAQTVVRDGFYLPLIHLSMLYSCQCLVVQLSSSAVCQVTSAMASCLEYCNRNNYQNGHHTDDFVRLFTSGLTKAVTLSQNSFSPDDG
eukprot:6077288-Amphidinium_carterae.1